MKTLKLIVMIIFLGVANFVCAQKLPGLDQSPVDIAIFRPDGNSTEPVVKVVYGRPQKKGRTMLGGKEAFGKIWRTGANETTEIQLFQDVTFGDKRILQGIYSFYTIPDKAEWTIIFNSKLNTWGAFAYDAAKDVARLKVPSGKSLEEVEAFTITFEGSGGTGNMILTWENTLIKIPVKY